MITIFVKSYEEAQKKVLECINNMPFSSDPLVYKEDRCLFEIEEYSMREINNISDIEHEIEKNNFFFIKDDTTRDEFLYWTNLINTECIVTKMVSSLSKDRNSRRCYVNAWEDQYRENPNISSACVTGFYARIIDGRLYFCSTARANDMINCLYIDLLFLHHIRTLIAKELGLKLGTHSHFAFSLQFYKKDKIKIITHE